jgi:protein-tyrosine-phosphatase
MTLHFICTGNIYRSRLAEAYCASRGSEAPPIDANTNSPNVGPDAWKSSADPRSVTIDGKGRVWVSVHTREAAKEPAFCGSGSNKFGNFYPLKQGT